METRMTMKKNQGFTLIEMLVVVAIVLILMTLLVPSGAAIRWQSKKTVCASNLAQAAVIMTTIATEQKGFYPMTRHQSTGPGHDKLADLSSDPGSRPGHIVQKAFNEPILSTLEEFGLMEDTSAGGSGKSYGSSLMTCPDRDYTPTFETGFGQMVTAYQYFGSIETWQTPRGKFNSRSPVRAGTTKPGWALLADAVGRIDGGWGNGRSTAYKDMPPHTRNTVYPEGGNVAFADGSARWIDFEIMFKLHSWSWGGRRDYYSYQEDTGDYTPSANAYGSANQF